MSGCCKVSNKDFGANKAQVKLLFCAAVSEPQTKVKGSKYLVGNGHDRETTSGPNMKMVRIKREGWLAGSIHAVRQFNLDVLVRQIMLSIFHSDRATLISRLGVVCCVTYCVACMRWRRMTE